MTPTRIVRLLPALLLIPIPAAAQDLPTATTPTDADQQAIDAPLSADSANAGPEPPQSLLPLSAFVPARAAYLQQSLILNTAGGWFSTASPLQTGGHDLTRSGLTLQGLEWASTAHVDPYLHFTAIASFTLGGVEIEEAYAQTTALPGNLQLKLGQFLLPVGRLNTQHLHAWHFADQPLHLGRVFGGDGGRALGLQLSWLAPLPWSCELLAAGTAAAGKEAEVADDAHGHGAGGAIPSLGDALATVKLKQYWQFNDDWGLQLGLAGQYGAIRGEPWAEPGVLHIEAPGAKHDDTKIIAAADLLLRWRPLADPDRKFATLLLEVLNAMPKPHDDGGATAHDDPRLLGLTAQLVVGLNPRWEAGARTERIQATSDDGDPWTQQRHAALVGWKPTEFSRLRLQGYTAKSAADPWQYGALLALEVFTGDHASHPF